MPLPGKLPYQQLYVVTKVERSWKNNSQRKKKVWKFDLLAGMVTICVQASFPITFACHCLEEEEDKRSLRSITTEFY